MENLLFEYVEATLGRLYTCMIVFANLINKLNQILTKMRVNDIRVISKDV